VTNKKVKLDRITIFSTNPQLLDQHDCLHSYSTSAKSGCAGSEIRVGGRDFATSTLINQGSYRPWKVLEKGVGPGKPWESPGILKWSWKY